VCRAPCERDRWTDGRTEERREKRRNANVFTYTYVYVRSRARARTHIHIRIHVAAAHGYLCIELNIRYIIHFKFFLLACPEIVCIIRTRTWKSADYLHRRGAARRGAERRALVNERASERRLIGRASERASERAQL